MKCFPVITFLLALTGATFGSEKPDAATWLWYESVDSQVYSKVTVSIFSNNIAKVFVAKNDSHPPIEYVTQLSSAEASWFLLVLRSTNFANPDRYEHIVDGGHSGVTTVRAHFDGRDLQAKFGRDNAFDNLSRNVFRLVRQAELLKGMERDHQAYEVLTGITDKRVLQPEVFYEPLIKYIHNELDQIDHAILALALITTPEKWGGLLAHELEQATDQPIREGSPLTRRQLLLQVITGHPFFVDLPDSHNEALFQIYHVQSAIESAKTGDTVAMRNVQRFEENEKWLKEKK